MLVGVLTTACGGSSGGDDDNDVAADDVADDTSGDLNDRCLSFYENCYQIPESEAASYCSMIDQYTLMGPCYEAAVTAYYECIFENLDCVTHDPSAQQNCYSQFTQALIDCQSTGDDSADDTSDDDATTTTTTTVTTTTSTTTTTDPNIFFSIDFEDYPLGPLGSPWEITFDYGTSTGTIVEYAKAGGGKVLEINGGTTSADYYAGTYVFGSRGAGLTISFDVLCESGAILGLGLFNTDGARAVVLFRDNVLGDIVTYDGYSTMIYCGNIADNVWANLKIVITGNYTYDVLINDSAVADCTGITTWDSAPFDSFYFIDWSSTGYGGVVYYDNVVGTTSGRE
jgi:hypothetical protein